MPAMPRCWLIIGLLACATPSLAAADSLGNVRSHAVVAPAPGRTPPKPICRRGTTARLFEDARTHRRIWRCIPNAPMR